MSRVTTLAVAKELIFTARLIDGDEALKHGIVNYSVEQNSAGDAAFVKALDLARQINKNVSGFTTFVSMCCCVSNLYASVVRVVYI